MIWKRFRNTDYVVAKNGKICRILPNGSRAKCLKGTLDGWGYPIVTLHNKGYFLHGIIAEVFLGLKPKGYEVNHKDGNKRNNRWDNLEYITRLENQRHAIRNGLWNCFGENHGKAKLTNKQVEEIRKKALFGKRKILNATELGKEYGMARCSIRRIVRGRSYKEI